MIPVLISKDEMARKWKVFFCRAKKTDIGLISQAKRLFLFLALLSITTVAMSQVYVTSYGYVGIGTTSPASKLQIVASGNDFTFKPSNPEPEIGAWDRGKSVSRILFWHSNAGYNELLARKYSTHSDSTLKTAIVPLANATTTLKQLKSYSYYFKTDDIKTRKKEYGVLAQEVEAVLPELVDTAKGIRFINYDGFIPFLIQGFNEQQKTIEAQENTIAELKKRIEVLEKYYGKESEKSVQHFELSDGNTEEMSVSQNAPNPFHSTTTIQCYIPQTVQKAQLCIYNMQGIQVKCLTISGRDIVDVQIEAGRLSAGVYAYYLIGDGKISETKQMILTN